MCSTWYNMLCLCLYFWCFKNIIKGVAQLNSNFKSKMLWRTNKSTLVHSLPRSRWGVIKKLRFETTCILDEDISSLQHFVVSLRGCPWKTCDAFKGRGSRQFYWFYCNLCYCHVACYLIVIVSFQRRDFKRDLCPPIKSNLQKLFRSFSIKSI